MCLKERERERVRAGERENICGACACVHSCVLLYEWTRVSATVNKSHGQPERATMVSSQTAAASTSPLNICISPHVPVERAAFHEW